MSSIPTVDLGAFGDGDPAMQRRIAAEVDDICREIGFLVIENHGVPRSIIDKAWSTCRQFFDQPLEEKMKARSPDPGCPRGYFPLASEALAKSLGTDTPPDIKESFGVGPLRGPADSVPGDEYEFHYGDNLWPDEPAELQRALIEYFNAMHALGSRVLTLFAAALELPSDFFERFHVNPMCALRCINYPAPDRDPLPEQRGAGAHADYGSITILKSDPDVPGLEVRMPGGRWVAAPLVDDAFIVNIGDMMARWTNDRWVSTLHRVASSERGRRRQSMAFFHNTSFDALIECIPTCLSGKVPKYAPVEAGQYLSDRFNAALETA